MEQFSFYSPTRMIFGVDALTHLGGELTRVACKKVLVLYGSGSVKRSGVLGKVTATLEEAKIAYATLGGVQPNPILSFVHEAKAFAMKEGVDFILAVGGGSTLDTAKAVSLAVANPEVEVWDYFSRKQVPTKGLKVGSVLTIAAAGSESSDSAVITNTETVEKLGFNSELNRPDFAILNPEFTFTLPKYQVACGVVDIFMHTSDRYFSARCDNELTDQLAEGLMRTVFLYGKTAVDNPSDYKAMSEIMWAGSVSHNGMTGLGNERDFSVHRLGRDMSAIYDAAHGATLAVSWVGFANYTLKHGENTVARFARYARNVWGLEGDDAQIAQEAIDKTRDYFLSLGMPITIRTLLDRAVTDQEIEELALACSGNKKEHFGVFYDFHHQDVLALYQSVT